MPGKRYFEVAAAADDAAPALPPHSKKVKLADVADDVEEEPVKAKKSKGKPHNGSDLSLTTVQATSLPPTMTSDQLSELFSAIGPIRSAFVVMDKADSSKSQCFGFVRFVLRDDAQAALKQLDGSKQGDSRIKVRWAKRRLREGGDDAVSEAPSTLVPDKPKWQERKEQQRTAAVDSGPDATRTVLVRGLARSADAKGDEAAELKKALYKKAKKIVAKAAGNSADISVEWPLELEGEPIAHIRVPNARTAQALSAQLNNHIFKSRLLLCCQQFEREAVTRKGRARGGARLIVRNLSWDVTVDDLAATFAAFGPLHSIDLPRAADAADRARGFAFIWMLRKPDAEKAIAAVNGTSIAPGVAVERVRDGADNRKKSERRKDAAPAPGADKAKARVVAVDWALSKDQWHATNAPAAPEGDAEMQSESEAEEVVDEHGRAPGEQSDGYLSEELSDSDESMFGDADGQDSDASESEEESLDDEAEDDEEVVAPAVSDRKRGKATADGMTLFVRNIQFEATEDELYALFKRFGPIQYARIAMDHATNRSRGTGFVHFYRSEDAKKVLAEAEKLAKQGNVTPAANPFSAPSILQADPSSSSARSLSLHGRVLAVSQAVSKDEADTLREARDRAGEKKDRRNLYLMREGVVVPESPLARSLHRSDLEARQSSFDSRKGLIRSNLSLYISRTRLSVRQLPLFVNDALLRKLALYALKAYDIAVKAGKQPALTADELAEDVGDVLGAKTAAASTEKAKGGRPPPSRVRQAKVVRQADRLDPLTGQGRSKGYGFIELGTHADALRVLRFANANRSVGALLRGWWRDDLASQLAKVEKDASLSKEEKKARRERLEGKVAELEAEAERAEAKIKAKGGDADAAGLEARANRTLIIELSLENAMTVKRRDERAEKSRQSAKRKRDKADDDDEPEPVAPAKKRKGDAKGAKAAAPAPAAPPAAEKKFGGLGSTIGRKRKERKQKRQGKA